MTCVAFAMTAAYTDRTADGVELSPEFTYWGCKRIDMLPPRDGTTLDAALTVLSRIGYPPEADWVYDEATDSAAPDYRPTLQACRAAWARRVGYGPFFPPTSQELIPILNGGDCAVLGVALFETWHHAGSDGRILMPSLQMAELGGHAVVVVGYRPEAAGTEFVVKNSWGAGWGDHGYGYLPAGYIDVYGLVACRL